jgi:hypothetical protein
VIWIVVAVLLPLAIFFAIAKWSCGEDVWGDP